jgi:uncharacterized protein YbcI
MMKSGSMMASQLAESAGAMEVLRSGPRPTSVTVVQKDGTLVITLNGVLSPAERALASTPGGAAQVQEFHRQLFASDSAALCGEILRITGLEVRQSAAEVAPAAGTVVVVFPTGTIVQVFLLTGSIPVGTWETGLPGPAAAN